MAITPYSGTVPNRLSTGDNEVYATQVYNWLIYLDGTWVSTVNSTEVNINAKEESAVAAASTATTAASTATTKALEAANSAVLAQNAANYKGDWVAGYATTGYSMGMSVSFTDGQKYVSKIDNNLISPVTLTNTTEWDYLEAVSPAELALKQDTLVSGTNIKTVNGESVLGAGDLLVGGGFDSIKVFTTSGTWTKPIGIKKIKIIATGGGAGGGDTTNNSTSGGGGGGATVIDYYDVSSLSSLNVTIGAGGASSIGSPGGGGAGGNTSIIGTGINVLAKGGPSFTTYMLGSIGGSALLSSGSPGAIKLNGGDGWNGGEGTGIGGNGGSSFFSGSTSGGNNHRSSHGVAPSYGGGAGGGTNSYNPAATGGNGIVVIEEYK